MGTALVNYKEELAKESANIASRIGAPGGDTIRVTQDKKFKMPDGTLNPGPMRVVILDFVGANKFFDRPFKEGEAVTPACYAVGMDPKNLNAFDDSPVKQNDECKSCPNNEWGSSGAGKACTNTRLLAVTEPTDEPNAPIYVLSVSKTAITAFDAYVQGIHDQFNSVPVSVVTEIYFDPSKTFASLRFGNPTPNVNEEMHYGRRKGALARLLMKPDFSQYTPPPTAKSGKKKA